MLKKITSYIIVLSIIFGAVPVVLSSAANDAVLYINTLHNMGLGSFSPQWKEGASLTVEPMPDESIKRIHFKKTNTTNDTYGNFHVDMKQESEPNFIFEFKIYPNILGSGGASLATFINDANKSSVILRLGYDKRLTLGSEKLNVALPYSSWNHIKLAVNSIQNTVDLYVNERLVKDDYVINNFVYPSQIGMQLFGTSTPDSNEMWIDEVKLYGGTKFKSFSTAMPAMNDSEAMSIMDNNVWLANELGSDKIITAFSDYYFKSGARLSGCKSYGKPYMSEDCVLMASGELMSCIFDCGEISFDGTNIKVGSVSKAASGLPAPPQKIGNIYYYPAAALARLFSLSAYIYEDSRGYALFSDTNKKLVNSEITGDNLERSDIIYRYMLYDRASAEHLAKSAVNAHPRLFAKEEDIYSLQNKISSDSSLVSAAQTAFAEADAILNEAVQGYWITPGLGNMFNACIKVRDRFITLSTAYMISSDTDKKGEYSDRAIAELEQCTTWQDWNINGHFLDSGMLGVGAALAYDTFYAEMTDLQRQSFRDRVGSLYLQPVYEMYLGKGPTPALGYNLTGSNWGAVCSASALYIALAFMGDDSDSEFNYVCACVAANAMKGLEYAFGHLSPDGGIADGIGYWEYYAEHTAWSVKAMQNTFGDDFGFLASPGYSDVVYFGLQIQTAEGCYNYSKTSDYTKNVFPMEMYMIADLYNDNAMMSAIEKYRKVLSVKTNPRYLLWYKPTGDCAEALGRDKYFKGQSVLTMRESFSDIDGTYAAAKLGKNTTLLSHYDKGSFIYDAMGIRWFVDSGHDARSVSDGQSTDNVVLQFGTRTEAHNSLVINPSENDAGQTLGAVAVLEKFINNPNGAAAIFDLGDVYSCHALAYKRGLLYGDRRRTLVVQDEISLSEADSELYWQLHTYADSISIDNVNKTAVLTQSGKELKVEFYSDISDFTIEAADASPLTNTQIASADSMKILRLRACASGRLTIAAKFIPQDGTKYSSYSYIPMSEWDNKLLRHKLTSGDELFADFNLVGADGYDNNDYFNWSKEAVSRHPVSQGNYCICFQNNGNSYDDFSLDGDLYSMPDGGIAEIAFDACFTHTASIRLEGFKTWFSGFSDIVSFGDAKDELGNRYPLDEQWHNIRYTYDIDRGLWSQYIDGKAAFENIVYHPDSKASTENLSFTFNSDDAVYLDNFRLRISENNMPEIIYPSEVSSTVSESITVTAKAQNAKAVNLFVDGMSLGAMNSDGNLYSLDVNISQYGVGSHSIRIEALYPDGSIEAHSHEISFTYGEKHWTEDFENLGADGKLPQSSSFANDRGERAEGKNGAYALKIEAIGGISPVDKIARIVLKDSEYDWPPKNGRISIEFNAYLSSSPTGNNVFGINGLPCINSNTLGNLVYYRRLYTGSIAHSTAFNENSWHNFKLEYDVDKMLWNVNVDDLIKYTDISTNDSLNYLPEAFAVDADYSTMYFDDLSLKITPEPLCFSEYCKTAASGGEDIVLALNKSVQGLEPSDVKVYVNGEYAGISPKEISENSISFGSSFNPGDEVCIVLYNAEKGIHASAYIKIVGEASVGIYKHSISARDSEVVIKLLYFAAQRDNAKQYFVTYNDERNKVTSVQIKTRVFSPHCDTDISRYPINGNKFKVFLWKGTGLVPVYDAINYERSDINE